MNFDHVHFFVDDALTWCDWFVKTLQFEPLQCETTSQHRQVWLQQGQVQICLSSPVSDHSPAAAYLRQHPAGVVDLAFAVRDVEETVDCLLARGGQVLKPVHTAQVGPLVRRVAQVAGWGDLRHTLVESLPAAPLRPGQGLIQGIDHAVLNVAQGDLDRAVAWYQRIFGFQPQQMFDIRTAASGLCSRVMSHAQGHALMPINEPSTVNSQVQEFLTHNGGSGIQHVALQSADLVAAIATFRTVSLPLLTVPSAYYTNLRHRPGYPQVPVLWDAITQQQILVDWDPEQPQAVLLQTFTQPLFAEPTFFFELIERRCYWEEGRLKNAQGFGKGNFQALFEAIEHAQRQRGSLHRPD
jgi:4-hydroxyphenylpyruvate dioxygenase